MNDNFYFCRNRQSEWNFNIEIENEASMLSMSVIRSINLKNAPRISIKQFRIEQREKLHERAAKKKLKNISFPVS